MFSLLFFIHLCDLSHLYVFFVSTFYTFKSKRKEKIYWIIMQQMNINTFETPKEMLSEIYIYIYFIYIFCLFCFAFC
jgi:hypothetical protein